MRARPGEYNSWSGFFASPGIDTAIDGAGNPLAPNGFGCGLPRLLAETPAHHASELKAVPSARPGGSAVISPIDPLEPLYSQFWVVIGTNHPGLMFPKPTRVRTRTSTWKTGSVVQIAPPHCLNQAFDMDLTVCGRRRKWLHF